MRNAVLLLAAVAAVVCGEMVRYDNFRVYQVEVASDQQKTWIQHLKTEGSHRTIEVWGTSDSGKTYDVIVSPELRKKFELMAENLQAVFSVKVEDVQKQIDASRIRPRRSVGRRPEQRAESADFIGEQFVRHETIIGWVETLAAQYPTVTEMTDIGSSIEGRIQRAIKMGEPGSNKPVAFFNCGIHAREWLSPATCMYIMDRLLREYEAGDAATVALLRQWDIHWVPLANPDGYEFTFTNDRLWRKNRAKRYSVVCQGVDLNRNWAYKWGETGASSNPCSDTFAGANAFSEIETSNLRDYIEQLDNLVFLADIHTYAQMWLIPWGYAVAYPPDFAEMKRVADVGVEAIRQEHNTVFVAGNSAVLLGGAAGATDDWGKSIGTPYSYTLELRPARGTWNGFVVDESVIRPSGEEVYRGLTAALRASNVDLGKVHQDHAAYRRSQSASN